MLNKKAQEALDQISENKYSEHYIKQGKTVFYIRIAVGENCEFEMKNKVFKPKNNN